MQVVNWVGEERCLYEIQAGVRHWRETQMCRQQSCRSAALRAIKIQRLNASAAANVCMNVNCSRGPVPEKSHTQRNGSRTMQAQARQLTLQASSVGGGH